MNSLYWKRIITGDVVCPHSLREIIQENDIDAMLVLERKKSTSYSVVIDHNEYNGYTCDHVLENEKISEIITGDGIRTLSLWDYQTSDYSFDDYPASRVNMNHGGDGK